MTSPLFIDANIPIYAAGRPHPLKQPCVDILVLVEQQQSAFATDAEVLQELVHHYLSVNAWSRGRTIFEGFANLMRGRIEPMIADDVEEATRLALQYPGLSARDLVHIAVMSRMGVDRIITADQGFDRVSHVRRLDRADLTAWQHLIGT